MSAEAGDRGQTSGRRSKNRESWATTAVTGAAFTFATLPASKAGAKRAFDSDVHGKRKRAGWQFMRVGPYLSSSYRAWICG